MWFVSAFHTVMKDTRMKSNAQCLRCCVACFVRSVWFPLSCFPQNEKWREEAAISPLLLHRTPTMRSLLWWDLGGGCKRHKQVVKRTAMRRGPHVASLTRSSCAWQARFPGRSVQTMATPCCNESWPVSSRSNNDLVGNQERESDRQSHYALWESRDNKEGEEFAFFNLKQVKNVIIT